MNSPAARSISTCIALAFGASTLLAQSPHATERSPLFRPQSVFRTSWIGFDTGTQNVARWPYAAKVADLDGDGRPDVAAVDWWAFPKLDILLNRGGGRLASPIYFNFAKGSYELVIADFSGDGKPDIAVSNTGSNYDGNTISLFKNVGNGSFAAQQQFSVGSGSFVGPVGLAAADFNGDGRIDLAVALYGLNGQGTQIALLTNNGAGGFLAAHAYPCGASPYKLAAGDLDGDGRPDLAVARDWEHVSILRNTGGSFAAPLDFSALSGFNFDSRATLELADLDRDGDLDVVYSASATSVNFVGAIAILRNHGDGTLAPAEALFTPPEVGGANDFSVGDIDGDGWPDILASHDSRWAVYRNDGHGQFQSGELYGATEAPIAIELADMDGDGHLDPIVVGRESLEAAVYHNFGNGDFHTPIPEQAASNSSLPASFLGMDSADIDGDGDLDVAIAYSPLLQNSGGVSILRGNGDGTFSPPLEYPSPQGVIYPKLADLDGDGHPDLLWADDSPPYDVKTRRNLGNGNFGALTTWKMNTCGNGEVAAIDVDNDGDRDIVLCEYAGCGGGSGLNYIYIAKNNGNGTFQPATKHVVPGFPERVIGADVNGDGKIDLLSTDSSWIDVSLGNGDGTFQPPIFASCDWGPKGFCVGDFNGDGVLDIATSNYGDGPGFSGGESVSILIGYGDGGFHIPVTKPGSYSATLGGVRDIVAGDADGDGDLDLMASNYGSLDVSYFENDGHGVFAPQVRYGTGWNTLCLAFGDFNGDGRGDLLTACSVGLSLSFYPALILLRTR